MPHPTPHKEVDGWEVFKNEKKDKAKREESHQNKFWGNRSTLAEEKQVVYSGTLLVLFQSNKTSIIFLIHLYPF